MIMVQRKNLNRSQQSLEEELLYLLETGQYAKYDRLLVDTYGVEPVALVPERKGTYYYEDGHCSDRVISLDALHLEKTEELLAPLVPNKYEVIQ